MLLAQIMQNQLTKDFINCITRNIGFNLNIILWIKIIWYWNFNKCLFQFGKSFFSFRNKKRS